VFDVASGRKVLALHEPAAAEHLPASSDGACFGRDGEVLLWGNTLWDVRAARAVHHFDQFSDYGGGCFHPAGRPSLRLSVSLSVCLSVLSIHMSVRRFARPSVSARWSTCTHCRHT
jgi:hypothetical protein